MTVHQFSTSVQGGAANAAIRLHQALRAQGVASCFWHGKTREPVRGDDYRTVPWLSASGGPHRRLAAHAIYTFRRKRLKRRFKRALRGRPEGLEMFSVPRAPWTTPFPVQSGDIVHLHWIAGLIDYPTFFASLPDDQPIVWTLHDMNPFTGGCHYSGTCQAFQDECRDCPQLGQRGGNDLSQEGFSLKRRAYRHRNLHVVTPSRWLEGEARRSRLLSHARSFQTIHYTLDLDLFSARQTAEAKRALGLPTDCLVLAFGAESLSNRRKGWRELRDALERIEVNSPVVGLVFGSGEVGKPSTLAAMETTGYVREPARQALIYSAADVFVLPSLEDNSPQTGIEAIACGTPVVAFGAGGIPDYVRPFDTGLLARTGDSNDLARCLTWLLARPDEMRRMGHNARRLAEQLFDGQRQADAYRQLYETLSADAACRRNAA